MSALLRSGIAAGLVRAECDDHQPSTRILVRLPKGLLIGIDFSYNIPETADRAGDVITSRGPDPNHFHPDYFGDGKTWHVPKLDRVLVSYRFCNEIYRAAGREITNATVGGRLEVFERQPLELALRSS